MDDDRGELGDNRHRSVKDIRLTYDRSDVDQIKTAEWVWDSLGVAFDSDGFMGR